MNRIMQANFVRMAKNKLLWIAMLVTAGFGTMLVIGGYNDMQKYGDIYGDRSWDDILFSFLIIYGIIMAVFDSMYIGTEYSDGTIRNKLIVGRKRSSIYLANLITSFTAGVLVYLAGIAAVCVVGIPLFGEPGMDVLTIVKLFVAGLLVCLSYASLYTMVGMLSSSKSQTAIINLLLAFILFFMAMYIYQMLAQGPEIENAVMEINGEIAIKIEKNPNYLSGIKRDIYQFIFDLSPSGQGYLVSSHEMGEPWKYMGYSAGLSAVLSIFGLSFFCKKDIK